MPHNKLDASGGSMIKDAAKVGWNRAAASTQPFGATGNMFETSNLKRTGQMWKLYLFFMVFPLMGLVLIGLVLRGSIGDEGTLSMLLVFLGLGLALIGFVLAVITVRCPKCKAALLWKAIKGQSHQKWFDWLVQLNACPVCKHTISASV